MSNHPLDPFTLLNGTDLRLTLRANLKPTSGLDRFQPAGFPEIGHVIYDAPRSDNQIQKVCIIDSAASMANHLESVCLASVHSLDLADELEGMPYVKCLAVDLEDTTRPSKLVVTTLSEGHRLASSYFLDGKVLSGSKPSASDETFKNTLFREFKITDLGNKSHPLPDQWWTVFKTIFRYDPNSLVHGVLFPNMGIKLPRILSAHLEAFNASRVRSSGVKFDRLGKTSSGQPIFSVDEETASEIVATFVIDLALLRSFGRGEKGLGGAQKEFLVALALWKIERLLKGPFRYRSNCDLELQKLRVCGREAPIDLPNINIKSAIARAQFTESPVTQIYWPDDKLFRPGENTQEAILESDDDQQ